MAYLQPSGSRWKTVPAQARTVTAGTLRHQIARTALRQVGSVQARAEALASLVLINEWPVSFRLAQSVASDLRALIELIGFYRDVSAGTVTSRSLDVFADYRGQARVLLLQLSCLEIEKDIVALSDWFDYNVAPWSRSMATTLQKIR